MIDLRDRKSQIPVSSARLMASDGAARREGGRRRVSSPTRQLPSPDHKRNESIYRTFTPAAPAFSPRVCPPRLCSLDLYRSRRASDLRRCCCPNPRPSRQPQPPSCPVPSSTNNRPRAPQDKSPDRVPSKSRSSDGVLTWPSSSTAPRPRQPQPGTGRRPTGSSTDTDRSSDGG